MLCLAMISLGLSPIVGAQSPLVQVGQPAPKLQVLNYVKAPNGTPRTLEGFKGSVVVLEFWATWCPPCIQAIPHLNALQEKFAGRPVKFLSISNEDFKTVSSFAAKQPFKTLVGSVDQASWARYVGQTGIPLTIILDKQGKVFRITSPSLLASPYIEEALSGKHNPDPLSIASLPSAGALASFSISLNKGEESGLSLIDFAAGRYSRKQLSIQTLVSSVWSHPLLLIKVDDALSAARYDIGASLPNLDAATFQATLRTLISSALKVKVEREVREIEVLVLRAPEGLKAGFKRSTSGTTAQAINGPARDFFDGQNAPMDAVAWVIEVLTSIPVINETKIEGDYDYFVRFESGSPESLAKALAPCGLVLTRENRKMEVLAVRRQ